MDPATVQLLITATVEALDLIGRLAEKQFDSREELDAYIAKRNELRERLVSLSLELGGQDPQQGSEAESSQPPAGEPTPATEQPPSDNQADSEQPQSDQESGDATSPDSSQG